MELPEVLKELVYRLDDDQIYALFVDPELQTAIKILFSDNNFWMLRVKYLVGYKIEDSDFNWKRIYYNLVNDRSIFSYIKHSKRYEVETFEVLMQNPSILPKDKVRIATEAVKNLDNALPFLNAILHHNNLALLDPMMILLKTAIMQRKPKEVRLLLEQYSEINTFRIVILLEACLPNVDTIEVIISYPCIQKNDKWKFEFLILIQSPKYNVIKELVLLKGGELNAKACNAGLNFAISNNNVEVASRMISNPKFDYGTNKASYLYDVILRGRANILQLILDDDRITFDKNEGKDLVFQALERRNVSVVGVLLKSPKIYFDEENDCLSFIIDRVGKTTLELLKLFIEDGRVDPTRNSNEVYKRLMLEGRKEEMEILTQDPRVSNLIQDY